MHRFVGFTAATLFAIAAGAPLAALADEDTDNAPVNLTQSNFASTTLDLGIEVGTVAFNHQSVMAFLDTLPAVTSDSVMSACETFMQHPVDAQSPSTIGFCAAAVS